MSEEKKQELLNEIKDALRQVPEQYHADIGKAITHDIGVMGKAIQIAQENKR